MVSRNEYFEAGYRAAGLQGAQLGSQWISEVQNKIDILQGSLNEFKGFETDTNKLQGDIHEFWHQGTFEIEATINESQYQGQVHVDRKHVFASPDLTTDFGRKYGLKSYKSGAKSAEAQAKSFFQRYKESNYKDEMSFEEYLHMKGIPEDTLMHDPIYSGQMRLIPCDQYEDAVKYLERKISEESIKRPELAAKYQDVLDNLTTKVESPDGVTSIEIPRENLDKLAASAKRGEADVAEFGLSTEELVKIDNIISQGVKAGLSAGVLSMVIKSSPEIFKCIHYLIDEGEINIDLLLNAGKNAISGGAEGFIHGFVSATITSSCKAGLLGASLKGLDPSIIGAMATVAVATLKDSISVATGRMDRYEMTANLTRNIFVSTCAVGAGLAAQTLIALPGAYLIGNFVGSLAGSFAYQASNTAIMALCVNNGYTLFGLVDQDYSLPDEVLKEIGVDIWETICHETATHDYYTHSYNRHSYNEHKPQMITMLRRGVVSLNKVAYVAYK